ncbi:unnamed protein product, partial [Symbiodinium sp. KB8]
PWPNSWHQLLLAAPVEPSGASKPAKPLRDCEVKLALQLCRLHGLQEPGAWSQSGGGYSADASDAELAALKEELAKALEEADAACAALRKKEAEVAQLRRRAAGTPEIPVCKKLLGEEGAGGIAVGALVEILDAEVKFPHPALWQCSRPLVAVEKPTIIYSAAINTCAKGQAWPWALQLLEELPRLAQPPLVFRRVFSLQGVVCAGVRADRPEEGEAWLGHHWSKLAKFHKKGQLRREDALSPVLHEEIGDAHAPLLPELVDAVRDKAGEMIPQGLSNCLWAAAKMQGVVPETARAVPAIAEHIPSKVMDFNLQELSNSFWASAHLATAAPEVLRAVPSLVKRIADLSNCLWAAVRLREALPEDSGGPSRLALIVDLERLTDPLNFGSHVSMAPQHLSNCFWAAANLQEESSVVLHMVPAIAKRIAHNSVDFTARASTPSVLEALPALSARLGSEVRQVAALVAQLPQHVADMSAQDAGAENASDLVELTGPVTAVVLASDYGSLQQPVGNSHFGRAVVTWLEALPAAAVLAPEIRRSAEDLNPQEISNSLWAAATLQDAVPEVLAAVPSLAANLGRLAGQMVPQDLSNCLWAAARLRERSPEVLLALGAVVVEIPKKVSYMIPRELASCLWAAATLRDSAPEVLRGVEALALALPEQVVHFNCQDLANSLWASAHLRSAVPQ